MIEVSKASFYYPNTDEGALNDVSLQINSGECVVLCGKSGCGKTTLTRLLNGLAPSFLMENWMVCVKALGYVQEKLP